MDALRQERRWRREAVGRDLGVPTWYPHVWAGEFTTYGHELDVMALPLGSPLVFLNFLGLGGRSERTGATFGQQRFILGISSPGGPDVLE